MGTTVKHYGKSMWAERERWKFPLIAHTFFCNPRSPLRSRSTVFFHAPLPLRSRSFNFRNRFAPQEISKYEYSKSESECKCLTCNQKPTRSLVYCTSCTNQTKRLMETKLKGKPLSSPVSVKAVRCKGWGLWREEFKEKASFEFRME